MNGKTLRFAAMTCLVLSCALVLHGCGGGNNGDGGNGGGGSRGKFLNMGTSPIGGSFQPVGNSLCNVLNNNAGENNWKFQAKGTKGSQENIRLLDKGEYELGISNSAISYHAVNGLGVWEKKFNIRAVATIAPLVGMFVTKEDSGIKTMQDLKGRRVVCGPNGAGFEMFLEPLLEAHGLKMSDFTKLSGNFSDSVTQMADGGADAAFLAGAVPAQSIQQANELGVHWIPYEKNARQKLVEDYPFFNEFTIKAGTYPDQTEDFQALNVGAMHLITSADQDEEFIYQVTKITYENRAKNSHPAAKKFINEENAPRFTGTEFHPGAIRFYQEIGIWPADAGQAKTDDAPSADAPATETEPSGDANDSQ